MKILLACQQSPHVYPIPAYRFWRTYFVEGLREAGHEVIEVPGADWARGLLPLAARELDRWRDEIWSRTLALAQATPALDLFLGYLYPQQIEPAAVSSLRRGGVPAVNFFCDNVREYRRLPAAFAPFDLHWVPEFDALPLYAARGWRTVFAPMPCWVPPARRQVTDRDENHLAFIGRRDALRAGLLASVARSGLPLAIHGAGWSGAEASASNSPVRPAWSARFSDWADFVRRQGVGRAWRRLRSRWGRDVAAAAFDFDPWWRPLPGDDAYADILARSAVSLGINRYPGFDGPGRSPPTYSRLRDIEAPMLGACYLTERAPGLERLYDLSREIETYGDADELIAKARALLHDPARRRGLRVAGQKRALREHSVGQSLARIATALGQPART